MSRLSAGGGELELVQESTKDAASSKLSEKNNILEKLRFDLLGKEKLLETKKEELSQLKANIEIIKNLSDSPDLTDSLEATSGELKATVEGLIKEWDNLKTQIVQLEDSIRQETAKPSVASNEELLALKTSDDKTFFMVVAKSELDSNEDFVIMTGAYSQENPLVVPFDYLELTALEMVYKAFCAQKSSAEPPLSKLVPHKENLVRLARRYKACGQFYFHCKFYALAQTCFEAVMRLDTDAKASAEAAWKRAQIHIEYALNKGEVFGAEREKAKEFSLQAINQDVNCEAKIWGTYIYFNSVCVFTQLCKKSNGFDDFVVRRDFLVLPDDEDLKLLEYGIKQEDIPEIKTRMQYYLGKVHCLNRNHAEALRLLLSAANQEQLMGTRALAAYQLGQIYQSKGTEMSSKEALKMVRDCCYPRAAFCN